MRIEGIEAGDVARAVLKISLADRIHERKGAAASSIIKSRCSPKPDATLPLAGSFRRRRSRRHDLEHWRGCQVSASVPARLQPDFVGHHPDQVEPAAAGAGAERALRARVSQGSAAAGYRGGGGS